MRTKEEIQKLDPIAAYNLAVQDCVATADIHCIGNPKEMIHNNCMPSGSRYFEVKKETILQNTIE